jgi:hypothetical protein
MLCFKMPLSELHEFEVSSFVSFAGLFAPRDASTHLRAPKWMSSKDGGSLEASSATGIPYGLPSYVILLRSTVS